MQQPHDDVLRELTRHFEAPAAWVWPGTPESLGIAVAFFSAQQTGRPWGTVATLGMSKHRMTMDRRATDTDTTRAELVAYVDEKEPPPHDLARWMQFVAAFPFKQQPPTFLGWGHTIPFPQPAFPGSALTTVFTIQPLVRPDKGKIFELQGEPVSLLWMTFLSSAEYALKKTQGENTILDLFAEHRHPVALARTRPSYV